MQFEELVYDVRDRVATITFNRAERLNAWTLTLEKELREAIALASADDGVRSIVLTGAGRAFCAGADMSRLSASAEGAPPPASSEQVLSHQDLEQRYGYLLGVPKPIVAGINGAIAGVGVCIALYCDLRYMAAGEIEHTLRAPWSGGRTRHRMDAPQTHRAHACVRPLVVRACGSSGGGGANGSGQAVAGGKLRRGGASACR